MKKLRVGVVGAGYLGKFHAEKYSQMDDVDLVGIADTNSVQAKTVSEKFKTNAYGDYHELMGKVDAVSIVVPTPAHYKVSRDFLENDIDVLIEKPITTTLREADASAAFAAATAAASVGSGWSKLVGSNGETRSAGSAAGAGRFFSSSAFVNACCRTWGGRRSALLRAACKAAGRKRAASPRKMTERVFIAGPGLRG